MLKKIEIRTQPGESLIDITEDIQSVIRQLGVTEGICVVSVPHTTAGLAVNSSIDTKTLADIIEEVDRLELKDPEHVALITQTTLSVDETAEIIARLRERFPGIVTAKGEDICYATTNRQIAVKQLARQCDLVLVIGSTNSSNSNRLVEVAREHGADSHLIDNHTQVSEQWLDGIRTVGITSGASAPEELVEDLVQLFRDRGVEDVSELKTVDESVRFMLPKEIRKGFPVASAT